MDETTGLRWVDLPGNGPTADDELFRTLLRAVAQATAEYIGDGRDEHILAIQPGCRRAVWAARHKIAAAVAAEAEAEALENPNSPLSRLYALLHANR